MVGKARAPDRSAMETCPLGIVEDRRGHLHRNISSGHGNMDDLSHQAATAADHGEGNRALEARAVVGRGDVADGSKRRLLRRYACDLRSLLEDDSGIDRGE